MAGGLDPALDPEPNLVPELAVSDLDASLRFWCDLLGFSVMYARWDERFAYVALGRAHVMLDQIAAGLTWQTAPLDHPLGRGMNLEIQVPDLDAVRRRLDDADWPCVVEPEERWYRTGSVEIGVRQLLVADPDGYLVRPQTQVGERPVALT